MAYKVIEEIWSVSFDGNERRLQMLGRPLFSGGGGSIAYKYAKERASEFVFHGYHEDAKDAYWWGCNEGERVKHRFVIRLGAVIARSCEP